MNHEVEPCHGFRPEHGVQGTFRASKCFPTGQAAQLTYSRRSSIPVDPNELCCAICLVLSRPSSNIDTRVRVYIYRSSVHRIVRDFCCCGGFSGWRVFVWLDLVKLRNRKTSSSRTLVALHSQCVWIVSSCLLGITHSLDIIPKQYFEVSQNSFTSFPTCLLYTPCFCRLVTLERTASALSSCETVNKGNNNTQSYRHHPQLGGMQMIATITRTPRHTNLWQMFNTYTTQLLVIPGGGSFRTRSCCCERLFAGWSARCPGPGVYCLAYGCMLSTIAVSCANIDR